MISNTTRWGVRILLTTLIAVPSAALAKKGSPPGKGGTGGSGGGGSSGGGGVVPAAPVIPDELDVFRVTAGDPSSVPRVTILLDNSSSMNGSPLNTSCNWFGATHNAGSASLKKMQQLQAVLVGCESADDGLLDTWANQMLFSLREISDTGASGTLLQDFTQNSASLETGILSVGFSANTPMTEALKESGEHFNNTFTDANTSACGQHFIIMVADGNAAGGGGSNYNWACDGATASLNSNEPHLGSEYMATHDVLCGVSGVQNIITYTVGISVTGSAARRTIQDVANHGDGDYFEAGNVDDLREAFSSIFSQIATRSSVTFSSISVERDESLFTGEFAFPSSYQPRPNGMFWGNIKKSCILPNVNQGLYDQNELTCLFKSPDGVTLLNNPGAIDLWSGLSSTDTNVGGVGAILRSRMGAPDGTPSTPYRPRNIVSWKKWHWGYSSVEPTNFSDVFGLYGLNTWVTRSEQPGFINRVHGYTWDATATGDPVEVPEWTLADTIHPDIIVLKYGTDCDIPGSCYLVAAANDGMLHFFDAATSSGQEVTALALQEFMNPMWNYSGKNMLRDINRQPSGEGIHRYYIDGGIRLFHEETIPNGIIDASEVAYLIVGLGRGGNAYYKIPVSEFNGTLSNTHNPIYPLLRTNWSGSAFRELQQTWASPYLNKLSVSGGSTAKRIAIFPTGHIENFDWPESMVPGQVPGPASYSWSGYSCTTAATMAGLPSTACNQTYTGGYPDLGVPSGVGPWEIPNAIAYQFWFSSMDLDPNDTLIVEDSQGTAAGAFTGGGQAAESWSKTASEYAFVFDVTANLYWALDGTATTHEGFTISSVEVLTKTTGTTGPHYPGLYIVDLDNWNGNWSFSNSSSDSGVLVHITKNCPSGSSAVSCIDQSTSPDLAFMTCPISSEVSVDTLGDQIRGVYVGDECGQIWKAYPDPITHAWKAKRLLSVNNGDFSSQTTSVGKSKDVRKIFRKLDLVLSNCPGQTVLGIYFGTGNVQRPNATDELKDAAITSGRDIVGVIWDDGTVQNETLANMGDATSVDSVDPKALKLAGKAGWYLELGPDERMLRDPVVFAGTAFFKSHTITGATGAACTNPAGLDKVYAVNNCTAGAVKDMNNNGTKTAADRVVWSGAQDIGGNLSVFTPRDSDAFVTTGNLSVEEETKLPARAQSSGARIYLWRMP